MEVSQAPQETTNQETLSQENQESNRERQVVTNQEQTILELVAKASLAE